MTINDIGFRYGKSHASSRLNGVNSQANETSNGVSDGYSNTAHIHRHVGSRPDSANETPVAICGMAMRLPGGIRSDSDLYEFLFNKGDARSVVPEDRYNIEAYYSPHGKDGTIGTKHGYFLNDIDYSNLDLSMFSFSAAEAEQLDPNHRLVLEVVREAFESSGEANWRGKDIGTYVGLFTEDWQEVSHKDTTEYNTHRILGATDFALPNRIAYEYDLKGPSMVIKTACSSAGIALHEALEAIRQGKITAGIVTGSNLIMAPGLTIKMTLLGSLSPEGSSKSFDASADGYARGEAVSAIYIKRLDEAIRDGNPVRAVIRSSATNVDGKTNGISMPNGHAHEALIRQAYNAIGLDMSETAMVEAHGTGTKVGDPIEAEAIGRCFGETGVYLGASKPNLGHSEGAAAMTSVMKAALSLENRTILPNIKFNNPDPRIPWDTHKLVVPVEPTPWPENKAERISVNSYGIGGSNVHFVIDSAASFGIDNPQKPSSDMSTIEKTPKKLLLFSANHEESLKRVAEGIESYLNLHPDRIDDTAYTLAQRREHLKSRSFSVVKGRSEPFEVSVRVKYQGPSQAAFVFTGQGAQWVHMGKELIYEYPTFVDNIRSMDRVLQSLRHAPSWSIEDILCNSNDKSLLLKAEFSQPLCTAIQIALVDLLTTWNIAPSAVVGHSSGELGAAYAAGALSARDAIIAAFYRGYVCRNGSRTGGMAAIGLGRDEVRSYLAPGVRTACENSDSSVTLSGDLDVLQIVMSKIKEARPDVLVRQLQVEMAYHSHHMTLVGDEYRELISEHLSPCQPKIPFYSSVKAKILHNASDFGPRYWQDNLESPVLFHSAVRELLAGSKDCAVHLEVGPHAALSGPLRQIYKEASATINYASVLIRGKDDTVSFLEAVGQLHCFGVKISYPSGPEKVVTDLPSYPWNYEKSLWAETRVQKNWRFRRHLPHDLLGLRILEGSDVAPTWRKILRTADLPWLNDHCVGDDTIFPAAGYIAIAGEAISQISDTREYTLRDVEISKALVLYNDRSVEIITSLQPQRLTTTSDSDWYTFQIISHDGKAWNKHCTGLVRSGRASPHPSQRTQTLQRKVSSQRWYTTMSRVGLNYSGKFARLENMAASVLEPIASADVVDEQDVGESSYMMHPSTIDMIFQSLTVAGARGIYRDFNKLFLPTFIEELYIGNGSCKAIKINTAACGGSDAVRGESYGRSNNEFVFSLKGFQGKSMVGTGAETSSLPLNTLQLQWKPHPEYLEAGKLMQLKSDIRDQIQICERLYVLCAIETRNTIQDLTAGQPHFNKFRDWLNAEYERYQKPDYPLVKDSRDLVQMEKTERRQLIEEVFRQCEAAGGWANANAIYRGYVHAADIFEGKISYLDTLLQDGVLMGVYSSYNDIWDLKDYMQLFGHAKPQMKVLEIGAGTGGLTAKFLEHLKSDYGERLYLKYTYTDISSGFFVQAKERFKDYEGIEYQALDISSDPIGQGFKAGEYDIIVASNVLHATPSLHDTLSNVRTLLRPDGQLFLQELCPITQSISYVMGPFAGWWLAEEDGRADCPFISPEDWDRRLRDAGFAGCDSVTLDYEEPYTWMANIIAKPAIEEPDSRKITLLHRSSQHSFIAEVKNVLQERAIEFDLCEWGQELPEDQDIISFVDLEARPLLQDIDEDNLTKLFHMVNESQQTSVLWLMPAAQINPKDPYAGQMLGLMRTIRSELAAPFATLELEDIGSDAAAAVIEVLKKTQKSRDNDDELDDDMEWVWSNGALNIGRFHWIPLDKDLCEAAKTPEAKCLTIRTPGLLQTLEWTSHSLGNPAAGEVHIKMTAVGLNQSDLSTATGSSTSGIFGLEGVGRVTKLGTEVTNLAVGDRVMTVGAESVGMASTIRRPAQLCIRIPDQLSDEEAATMPLAYITVLMFLVEKWRLHEGQTILIHSAAGGVGICAINVAKWLGLKIYATVGSEEKASFLTKEFGIPRNHIFHSRDNSFLKDVMDATNGAGVDMVLNPLSGELLSTSWKCVAPDGAMAEIGKRDMAGRGQLSLAPFEDNRTFLGGDVARFMITQGSRVARLLELLLQNYLKGDFKPITPITTFDAAHIEEAFKYMQKGLHIGKIVVKFPEEDTLPLAPTVPLPEFRSDGTYVLVGGLGGLGKAIAGWMVSYGAKNLMFLSRSAGKSLEDQEFFVELNLMGCATQYFAVDIADATAVKEAVSQATLPIVGAMHMAMVLADKGILDMDIEAWNRTVNPKVRGAWNLHNHLPKDMDFFILFSSVCGIYGYYGQCNYASANTFLDSFSQYRQSQGLPASVMSIGPIDDVGFVSRTASTRETLLQNLASLLTESEFLQTLQLAIARSSTRYGPKPKSTQSPFSGYQAPSHMTHSTESSVPIMDPENGTIWKRDPRMSIYRNIQKVSTTESTTSGSQLKQFLSAMAKEPSKLDQKSAADTIARELGNCISNFMMAGDEVLDLTFSLSAIGVDSLVAIEIRNWWKQNLGTDISVLELLGGGSIEQLGAVAAQRLKVKYAGK